MRWPEFGDITNVKEGSLADRVDVIVKTKMGSYLTPKLERGTDCGQEKRRRKLGKNGAGEECQYEWLRF